jgi:hypothetical protein
MILRETTRAITPFGGVAVFVACLRKIDLTGKVREHLPVQWRPPNHIEPTAAGTAFRIAVLAGAKRFAHVNWLRGDHALHALLGLERFPGDGTIRNLFRPQSLPAIQHGQCPAPVRATDRVADAKRTGAPILRTGSPNGSATGTPTPSA